AGRPPSRTSRSVVANRRRAWRQAARDARDVHTPLIVVALACVRAARPPALAAGFGPRRSDLRALHAATTRAGAGGAAAASRRGDPRRKPAVGKSPRAARARAPPPPPARPAPPAGYAV